MLNSQLLEPQGNESVSTVRHSAASVSSSLHLGVSGLLAVSEGIGSPEFEKVRLSLVEVIGQLSTVFSCLSFPFSASTRSAVFLGSFACLLLTVWLSSTASC